MLNLKIKWLKNKKISKNTANMALSALKASTIRSTLITDSENFEVEKIKSEPIELKSPEKNDANNSGIAVPKLPDKTFFTNISKSKHLSIYYILFKSVQSKID